MSMRRLTVLLMAFSSGFIITGIEITVGRLLAPHFGTSLSVWAAIIASIIIALSLGYPLVGYIADRHQGLLLPVLCLSTGGLLGAGLGFAAPLVIGPLVEGTALFSGVYWMVLVSVLSLFGLPCILLAGVSPAAMKLLLDDPEKAGWVAGRVSGCTSAGSVVGILLPGLYLIPFYGVRKTFLVLAVVGVITSALPLLVFSRRRLIALLGTSSSGVMVGLLFLPTYTRPSDLRGATVLYEAESSLQHIRIIARDSDYQKRRYLLLNEGRLFQSVYFEKDMVTGSVLDYMALTSYLTHPDDGKVDVAIIGLAGGTVSTMMHGLFRDLLPGLAIVGVELDPGVVYAAKQYMGLDEEQVEIHIGDGRPWLRSSGRMFDVIILDAYRQATIPAHLATVEFFSDVRAHLSTGGIAVLNLLAVDNGAVYQGFMRTWSSVFPRPWIVALPSKTSARSNLLLGGPGLPLDLSSEKDARLPASMRDVWDSLMANLKIASPSFGEPWTDDLVPVEALSEEYFSFKRGLHGNSQ